MESVIYAVIVLGVLGGIFGAILAFASKIFHVEVDPSRPLSASALPAPTAAAAASPAVTAMPPRLPKVKLP